jgi:hypothetical protein
LNGPSFSFLPSLGRTHNNERRGGEGARGKEEGARARSKSKSKKREKRKKGDEKGRKEKEEKKYQS